MSFEESHAGSLPRDREVSPVAGLPAPNPHATAEQVEAARKDSKLAQVLYHDWEAESYDDKWSISYDQRCIDYARGRFDAIVTGASPKGTWVRISAPAAKAAFSGSAPVSVQ